MKHNVFYCDGSPNEGLNGFVVVTKGMYTYRFYDEPRTVSTVEYDAIIFALQQAYGGGIIYTDNLSIVNQLNDNVKSKIRAKHLKSLYEKTRELMWDKNIKIKWISRDKNPAGKLLSKLLWERRNYNDI